MVFSSATKNKILTGAVAVITASGAVWGASLKMGQEEQARIQRSMAATPEEKISTLLAARENLVAKRKTLEGQLQRVEARQAESTLVAQQRDICQQNTNKKQG